MLNYGKISRKLELVDKICNSNGVMLKKYYPFCYGIRVAAARMKARAGKDFVYNTQFGQASNCVYNVNLWPLSGIYNYVKYC